MPFVAAPGWRPPEQGGTLIPPEVSRPQDEADYPPVSRNLGVYVFVHFVVLLVLATLALFKAPVLGGATFAALAITVVVSLVVLSRLLEQKRGARGLEAARVLLLLGLGIVYGPALLTRLIGNA